MNPISPPSATTAQYLLSTEQVQTHPTTRVTRRSSLFGATLFKEWIKLRLYWILLFIASVSFAAFLCLRLRHVHHFNDAVTVWSAWMFKGYLFFHPYRYVPLAAGVLLGALQFLPEILSHRIRLVLHLPLGEERVISQHLLVGLLGLTGLLAAPILLFVLTGYHYFPVEFQRNLGLTVAPWLLAGYSGYLLAAALLLETAWRYRVVYLLLGGASLRLFFLEDRYSVSYDVYLRVLPALAIWTVALFLLPLFSSYRFRKGIGS